MLFAFLPVFLYIFPSILFLRREFSWWYIEKHGVKGRRSSAGGEGQKYSLPPHLFSSSSSSSLESSW